MKLRLRSSKSIETIRIEVSDQCTLQILKQRILKTLGSASPPDSLHLSLNRKHELQESPSSSAAVAADSLRSLGIVSGDLVFFTFNSSKLYSAQVQEQQIRPFQSIEFDLEKLRFENFEPIGVVRNDCSRSIFLQRVKEELGRNARKFLVTAVHSVLSKCGFAPIDRVKMPEDSSSASFLMSIRYALPRLNTKDEVVLLKFQCSEHFVMAYGFVSCVRESRVYCVSLDERTFPPNLDSVSDETKAKIIERRMLEFWDLVKDSLALPLWIDMRKASMLFHPPRFFLLPDELKLTIFEALSGVDIAKLQCACAEFRNWVSINDMWRLKFIQEFPLGDDSVPNNGDWKQKFVAYHKNKMMRRIIIRNIGLGDTLIFGMVSASSMIR